MEILSNLATGFGVAFSASNLLYCLFGVTVGTFIGVLPGIGPLATISMLLPLTFSLNPIGALIMLAGIYYGSMYGSAVTSILLNTPGHAASAVVCLDGHPMAKNGQGALALVISAIASFFGGTVAIILLMSLAPAVATFGLRFGAQEYFSMMVLALTSAAGLSQGSFLKGVAMVLLGLAIATVGIDVNSGAQRFLFGQWSLSGGISFVIVAMGFFAIAEVVSNLEGPERGELLGKKLHWREMFPPLSALRRSVMAAIRGTGTGFIFGALPGSGPTIATFVSYGMEKRVARDPSRFGKGAHEGIAGPEAANNSAAIAGFIPTLTLGVPGDAIMAMMLGALIVFGVTPGPGVIEDNPELFWGLMASMWIGNLLLLILNIPFIGVWVKVLQIPYNILYLSILLFICIGVHSISNNTFDVLLLAAFGGIGYFLTKLDFPAAPLLLGVILGPMLEENLRRAMLIARGDLTTFFTRPISLTLLLVTAAIVLFLVVVGIRDMKPAKASDGTA
ncbi:tripartite tricarboxylate transporter TctA family protein (plasmid) [Antarctobacter heliothermus]|uniref:Tripartite tricarboxylate transporter TctA family protein n=1 Tax=Antarctobacter heliothermus TaxID=74033 RepID=A0A222EBI8_9RHOB|nr:tripartite tricarboxylate transporter permease [Antarctobacter heliothermus]ASP23553.1 tripartite tricarboxylate transporter TctA family protein [Antarctobacter heliothermus]